MAHVLLNVVYDLRILPATFDYAMYMCTAYARAKSLNIYNPILQPIILTGKTLRSDYAENNQLETEKRLHNLLIPLNKLVNFTLDPIVLPSMHKDLCLKALELAPIIFPRDYSFESPELFKYYKNHMWITKAKSHDMRRLENTSQSLESASLFLKKISGTSSPITISERKNSVSQDRSRDTSYQWLLEVSSELSKISPVVILADYKSNTCITGKNIYTCYEPGYDIYMRSSIYEKASLSVIPNGGISYLAGLNSNTTYIQTGLAASSYFDESWLSKNGYIKDFNHLNPKSRRQIWTWDLKSSLELYQMALDIFSLNPLEI